MQKEHQSLHRLSLDDPETFWGERAKRIHWDRPYNKVLEIIDEPPGYRWFPGGRLNTCYNALDRHVEAGRGDQPALIYDSPVTDTKRTYSYRRLTEEVARFAGALAGLGVARGDRVVIYMPMVPEAVIAMLACARLGAVHSVVFGGFAAKELAVRIDDAGPKVVVSATCGIEVSRIVEYGPLLRQAIDRATHKPDACVVLQRPQCPLELIPGEHDWHELMTRAEPQSPVSVEAGDPLYLLYTSGTTGRPKGVVRDNGGHAVALGWTMEAVYGVQSGEVFWAASDVGWVVGHSYIVYGPLLAGNTTLLYEGKPVGTPDAGAFWRVIEEHNVSVLFTAPTAFRAIKKEDPDGELLEGHEPSSFRTLFLAGERCDPDTLKWAEELLGVPVIDHWWQTETGWPIASNCMGIEPVPIKPGSASRAVPGWDLQVLDAQGDSVKAGTIGALAVKLPLPPGTFPTLWRDRDRFVAGYLAEYPGYYQTADAGYIDKDGYVFVMARTDDIINVAGHRLSTGAMEEAVAGHPDVAECAVTGIADPLKGQIPLGFLVLKAGVDRDHTEIVREVVQTVREQIGPVASFKQAAVVERLPKTRSGKILRRTLRTMADGEPWTLPATIDDPAILDEIAGALEGLGYGVVKP